MIRSKVLLVMCASLFSFSNAYADSPPVFDAISPLASDDSLTSSAIVDITVTNAPVGNLPPEWSGIKADWTIGDGTVLSFPVEAVDPEDDAVTVSISDAPSWVSFDGKVLRARPGAGEAGLFSVTLTASDSDSSSSLNLSINVQPGEPGFPANWMDYMGSVGGTGADWAEWKRHWLAGVTGMSLISDPGLLINLESSAKATLETQDLMLPVAGFGKGEAKMADFMNLIHYGGLNIWRKAVTKQVEVLSTLDPDAKRVFYQLGNEITIERISSNVRNWAATTGWVIPGIAQNYDHEIIYYYVEYYLAPTIEAANRASGIFYGVEDKLNIVLGSIGNGGNQDAQDFLDALLEYEIQGKYATSLRGIPVHELIDLISVHYIGSPDNVDLVWDKWVGVGSISGLWTTEEIGIRAAEAGSGAGRAVILTGRYLEWFYRRNLSPDQSRVAFYAWDIESTNTSVTGTSADESMLVLQDFMGNVPLEVLTDNVSSVPDTELYQYNSLEDDTKRVVVVAGDNTLGSSLVETVRMDSQGWSGTVEATLYHFSPSGYSVEVYTLTPDESGYEIVLSTPITFYGTGDALLITLQKI